MGGPVGSRRGPRLRRAWREALRGWNHTELQTSAFDFSIRAMTLEPASSCGKIGSTAALPSPDIANSLSVAGGQLYVVGRSSRRLATTTFSSAVTTRTLARSFGIKCFPVPLASSMLVSLSR